MIYLVLGVLRLGFVTHFLSRPIISAFLTAGTIIISLSQVSLFPTTCHADLSRLCPYPDVYHHGGERFHWACHHPSIIVYSDHLTILAQIPVVGHFGMKSLVGIQASFVSVPNLPVLYALPLYMHSLAKVSAVMFLPKGCHALCIIVDIVQTGASFLSISHALVLRAAQQYIVFV